jgi:EAL domain-containing protein (putative c-di-GMP-specific phosphodiesterase class I)
MSNYLSKAFLNEIKYDSYYLDGGIFALITADDDEAALLASKINEAIVNVYAQKLEFNADYVLCSAKLPYDFKDFDDFNEFIFDFSDSIEFNKRLMNMRDVKTDDKHNIIMRLDDILDKIIEKKEIMVEYQPIYKLVDKKYRAVEALARIYDSKLGVIKAENFINYAEKKNRIFEIDMIIVEKVFQFYNAYQLSDYGLEFIAINLSTQTICAKEFLLHLIRLEKKYNVDRNRIIFEVKERESATFNQHVFDTIVQMMEHGFIFALDNYGTGSMPVDNLVKVPYKNIKLDNTFAKNYGNKNTHVIIDNTIKLFKRLNKLSTCVGVESEEAARVLEALNPDCVQGYYYSEPLALDDLIIFLKKENNLA